MVVEALEINQEKQEAAIALGVGYGELNDFRENDAFNPGNVIAGYLCRREDEHYGALYINEINGRKLDGGNPWLNPQIIYCTPKIKYPFVERDDGERVYHWPISKKVRAYEKYDGTNIFGYTYIDWQDDGSAILCVTWKTRLTPTLKGSDWGDWVSLWNRMLEKYPGLVEIAQDDPQVGVSIELFGNQNPHLVAYDVDLDVRVLFGIRTAKYVKDLYVSPTMISVEDIDLHGVPGAEWRWEVENGETSDYTKYYSDYRDSMAEENKDGIKTEGMVVYCHTYDGVKPWKCKPFMIEEIHWAGDLNKNLIRQAALKVLEQGEELTPQGLVEVLKEDWPDAKLSEPLVTANIVTVVNQIKAEIAYRRGIMEQYRTLGISIRDDKREVMRAMSQFYPRSEMRKVYGAIAFEEKL